MEDRLGEGDMETILGLVSESVAESTAEAPAEPALVQVFGEADQDGDVELQYPDEGWGEQDAEAFDDTGEGAGVEGDLEMDEE